MARRRRPPVEGPPAELLVFRGDDWIGDDGVPPLERWHKARFEWAKAHRDDLKRPRFRAALMWAASRA
jgi:hypothetical protein